MVDLTYRADGVWIRFYPESEEGLQVWREMASNGDDAIFYIYKDSFLSQLRKAGYTVRKLATSKPTKFTKEDEELLQQLTN